MVLIHLNSFCGNRNSKGLIFTMDVVFAVGVTLLLLLASAGVLVKSKGTAINNVNAKRVTEDIVAVLDYNDVLDTFDKTLIQGAVNSSLPSNVKMYMIMSKYSKDGALLDQITINDDIPDNFFLGKWIFVTTGSDGFTNNFYLVRYKVAFI